MTHLKTEYCQFSLASKISLLEILCVNYYRDNIVQICAKFESGSKKIKWTRWLNHIKIENVHTQYNLHLAFNGLFHWGCCTLNFIQT